MREEQLERFYHRGWVAARSIEEFSAGLLHRYLTRLYGPLIFAPRPAVNFINVHRERGRLVFSEGVFFDRFPKARKLGGLFPRALQRARAHEGSGGSNPLLRAVAVNGWASWPAMLDDGDLSFFERARFAGDPSQPDEPDAGYIRHEGRARRRNPGLARGLTLARRLRDSVDFTGNPLLAHCGFEPLNVLRYTEGRRIDAHSDVLWSSPLIGLYYLNATPALESGRELVVGAYDFAPTAARIARGEEGFEKIERIAETLLEPEAAELPPRHGRAVLLNNFNPRFYHAVRLAAPGQRVYAVSAHFSRPEILKGRPKPDW